MIMVKSEKLKKSNIIKKIDKHTIYTHNIHMSVLYDRVHKKIMFPTTTTHITLYDIFYMHNTIL